MQPRTIAEASGSRACPESRVGNGAPGSRGRDVPHGSCKRYGHAVLRLAIGLALWFGLAGCAQAERLLQPDQCTLGVTTDTFDGKVPVEPPYTLTLATPGVDPPTAIGFTGTGWTTVDITQISPDGVVVDTFRGNGVDDRGVVFPIDRPGQWTFRLIDQNVGCVREIKVIVALTP